MNINEADINSIVHKFEETLNDTGNIEQQYETFIKTINDLTRRKNESKAILSPETQVLLEKRFRIEKNID